MRRLCRWAALSVVAAGVLAAVAGSEARADHRGCYGGGSYGGGGYYGGGAYVSGGYYGGGYGGGYYGGYYSHPRVSLYSGYGDPYHVYSQPSRIHYGPHGGSHVGPVGGYHYGPHSGYHYDLHGGYGHFYGL